MVLDGGTGNTTFAQLLYKHLLVNEDKTQNTYRRLKISELHDTAASGGVDGESEISLDVPVGFGSENKHKAGSKLSKQIRRLESSLTSSMVNLKVAHLLSILRWLGVLDDAENAHLDLQGLICDVKEVCS